MKTKNTIPIQRKGREWALQLLYQLDVTGGAFDEQLLEFFYDQITKFETDLGKKETCKIRAIAESIVNGVSENLLKIDDEIIKYAQNWRIERMAIVDRNILRIAIYEILYHEHIPSVVSINEAIEIAKVFGGDDSGKFVNGILDNINKKKIP